MQDRARILIVEDDAAIAKMLGRALGVRYDVEIASDGEAGLAALLTPPPPDLVIADVMMPKLDGFSMIKQMRAKLTQDPPPVIFLTAKNAPRDIVAGIQAGARSYMTKPVKLEELNMKVKKAIGR